MTQADVAAQIAASVAEEDEPKATKKAAKAPKPKTATVKKTATNPKGRPSIGDILMAIKPGQPAEITLASVAHIKGGTDAVRRRIYGVARAKGIAVATGIDPNKKVIRIWLKGDDASATPSARTPRPPTPAPKPAKRTRKGKATATATA